MRRNWSGIGLVFGIVGAVAMLAQPASDASAWASAAEAPASGYCGKLILCEGHSLHKNIFWESEGTSGEQHDDCHYCGVDLNAEICHPDDCGYEFAFERELLIEATLAAAETGAVDGVFAAAQAVPHLLRVNHLRGALQVMGCDELVVAHVPFEAQQLALLEAMLDRDAAEWSRLAMN